VKIGDSGFVKRAGHARRAGPGERAARASATTRPRVLARVQRALARGLAFRTLLDKLGLSRVQRAYTARAPGSEIFAFFPDDRAQPQAGLRPDRDVGHLRRPPGRRRARGDGGHADAGHAGADLGERRDSRAGESVFLGYYNNPEATARRSRTGGSAP